MPAQIHDPESFQSVFNAIPLVTKVFTVGTLLMGACASFGLVTAEKVVLIWPLISGRFEFWRLFTNFFFIGPFSFNFAMHTYILYQNCRRYEENPFNTGGGGTSADMLWMVIVCGAVLLVIAYFFNYYILAEQMLYVVMYMWSRRSPTEVINMFSFKFKAVYLPWVYMVIRMIMGGDIVAPLVGVAVGHAYFFAIEVFPSMPGNNIGTVIYTPKFCIDFANYCNSSIAPSTPAPQPAAARRAGGNGFPQTGAGGYNWGGGGRTLGTS